MQHKKKVKNLKNKKFSMQQIRLDSPKSKTRLTFAMKSLMNCSVRVSGGNGAVRSREQFGYIFQLFLLTLR